MAQDQHMQDINNVALAERACIEIKKKVAFEKGITSKVLMVYTISDEAININKQIFNAKFKRFRYISCKLSDSLHHLGAIHNNELANFKACFEITCNTKLTDTICNGIKQSTIEEEMRNAKHGEKILFIAIERRSGKFIDHGSVALNPKMKDQAKRWLITEYPLLNLMNKKAGATSAISLETPIKNKHIEDLKSPSSKTD